MQTLEQVDQAIDGVRATLVTRLHAMPTDVWGWQRAWDRCPDLYRREKELLSARYDRQRERDEIEYKAAQKTKRAELRRYRSTKSTPCPSCGSPMWAA